MGVARTYKHPLIPEDVLLDKSGLSVLFEQSITALPMPVKSSTDTNEETLGVDNVEDTNEVVEDTNEVVEDKEALTVTELGIEVYRI